MAASLFQDVPLKAKVIGWGIIFIPLAALALISAIFLRPEPIDQRLMWGCYVAHDAPPLDIHKDVIYIIEPARRTFSYTAEPSKTSYQLNVQPALLLKLRRQGSTNSFLRGASASSGHCCLPPVRTEIE